MKDVKTYSRFSLKVQMLQNGMRLCFSTVNRFLCMFVFPPSCQSVRSWRIPNPDLTLSYISPQCSAVSPLEQVAWITDASAERTSPHMARTYQSHMCCVIHLLQTALLHISFTPCNIWMCVVRMRGFPLHKPLYLLCTQPQYIHITFLLLLFFPEPH